MNHHVNTIAGVGAINELKRLLGLERDVVQLWLKWVKFVLVMGALREMEHKKAFFVMVPHVTERKRRHVGQL